MPDRNVLDHSTHATQRHQVTVNPAQLPRTKQLEQSIIPQLPKASFVHCQQTRRAELLAPKHINLGFEGHQQIIFTEPIDEGFRPQVLLLVFLKKVQSLLQQR